MIAEPDSAAILPGSAPPRIESGDGATCAVVAATDGSDRSGWIAPVVKSIANVSEVDRALASLTETVPASDAAVTRAAWALAW